MYDRWGSFGRPVVLLHGLLFDRTMWWPVAAELATVSCTIVAPDLPGHGYSPARDDYRLERLARDLAGLVDGLGLHRAPILVGHAASALLAATFATEYATHGVITVDEPPAEVTDVDDLADLTGLELVPEVLRPYARPRSDRAVLSAYASWIAQPPAHRNQPAMAGGAQGPPAAPAGPLAHLTDPEGFAAQLMTLL